MEIDNQTQAEQEWGGIPQLNETESKKSICFAFTQKEKTFLYPFLLQSIPGHEEYKDISTPYGYGGPITNTKDLKFLREAFTCLSEKLISNNVIAEVIKFHPLIKNQTILTRIF